jgi:toluene monooxygenase system protein B
MEAQMTELPEPEGQPVPINALFENDFVTQLILVLDTDTIDEAAQKVAYHVVGRRQRPREAGLVLRVDGKVIPGHLTVAEAGIAPLCNVLVGWAQ